MLYDMGTTAHNLRKDKDIRNTAKIRQYYAYTRIFNAIFAYCTAQSRPTAQHAPIYLI